MVAALPSSDLFPLAGTPARRKVLILGNPASLDETVMNRLRSLQLEHVSPATLMRREISRPASARVNHELAVTSAMRRWFWTRKPDAGFFLTDFPATLLQALTFDEWLETRCETLDLVVIGAETSVPLIQHYSNLGLPLVGHDGIAP